jgi:flagellar FliL protein
MAAIRRSGTLQTMSAASAAAKADATDAVPAPPRRSKKKLLIIGGALVLLLVVGGGAAAMLVMKQRAAAAAEQAEGTDAEEGADVAAAETVKHERKGPPTFTPLDPFTVNLADRDAERYAQVGITLELEDAKVVDTVKQFMPAIRHNVLMLLSQKTAGELLGREGKQQLADDIKREALKALEHDDADGLPPVRAVAFSNFIIQ